MSASTVQPHVVVDGDEMFGGSEKVAVAAAGPGHLLLTGKPTDWVLSC